MGINITTTTPVQYHGWTLPAGSTVTVDQISLTTLAMMNHSNYPTVTAYGDTLPHNIALPTYAFDIAQIVIK